MRKTKLIVGISWAISACTFLWLFSLAQPSELSKPPTLTELIDSFLLFSAILLGSGASYHFLVEILKSSHEKSSNFLWRRLMFQMTLFMLVMISIPSVILMLRDFIGGEEALLKSLIYLLLMAGVSMWLATLIEVTFREIRSKN